MLPIANAIVANRKLETGTGGTGNIFTRSPRSRGRRLHKPRRERCRRVAGQAHCDACHLGRARIFRPQRSTLNAQPPTLNPQPSTLNPQHLSPITYHLSSITYPLSIFPESERRRIAADFGQPRIPEKVKRAIAGAEKAIARSRKRAEKGLCTKDESEAFCAKSAAALRRYLDKQVESGTITPAERKALGW